MPRTRRKIKGRGGAAVAARNTSRSRSRSRSKSKSKTGAKDSADAVAAVAEVVEKELEKELKQDEDNINNIIEKIGKWVDDHPGDAAEILSDFEDRYKKQRGGAAQFDHDGVALQPEQVIAFFLSQFAFWVWRSLTNQRDRTIFAVVLMVATGAGFGIGVALRVGLMLALVGVPLDHFFPRQNPIQLNPAALASALAMALAAIGGSTRA
jgi:hypothetical protein